MPIEIRELHIKVSVTSPEAAQGSTGTTSSGARSNNHTGGNNNEEIVAACVEKVMEILQNKRER